MSLFVLNTPKVLFSEFLATREVDAKVVLTVPKGRAVHVVDDRGDDRFDATVFVFVCDEGSMLTYEAFVAGKNRAFNVHVVLEGRGSSARLSCLCKGEKHEKYIFNTFQHHKAPNSTSDVMIKGVFFGSSSLTAKSMIRIEKGAQGVRASEHNKNLLIGDMVRVDSLPTMEVEADEVACSHGAAMSRIRSEDFFYLQSRGLSRVQSEQLLVEAFLRH